MTDLCSDDQLNEKRLYEMFRDDFLVNPPTHNGISLLLDCSLREGRESSYWHLTRYGFGKFTLGIFDVDRARRLCWVKPIVQHAESHEIEAFNFLESNGRIRRYLWVRKAKFVVILEPATFTGVIRRYRLITSFYVDFSRKEMELEAKHRNRIK
jgi:hypothetical protein